ncbi:MAG: Minf_1886 family protein [Phycisphaerales bacterium]
MPEQDIDIKTIFERAGGYSPLCLGFIRDGLAHTVEMVHGRPEVELMELEDESRHVSGQQLCIGLRDFALQQYGLMAKPVLNKWGIHGTRDFGCIIFAMVQADLMRKTDDDTLDDFDGVYQFDEAFAEPELVASSSADGTVL